MLLDDYKNVNKKLTSEEVEEQLIMQEDYEAIVEWLKESGYAEIADDYSIYDEAVSVTKSSTLKGKKRQLTDKQYANMVQSMAAISAARQAGSSDYKKLVQVSRLRKKLIAKINKQYASGAKKVAKQALKDARKNSNTVVKTPAEGVGGTKGTPNKPKVSK